MEGKYTQVEFSKGLFELDETTLKELAGSKYMNDDLRPTTKAERTWNTYNISMLWIGMVICITGFSFAAALIALGMSPILALINVAIGNLLVLVPMQLEFERGNMLRYPVPDLCKTGIRYERRSYTCTAENDSCKRMVFDTVLGRSCSIFLQS